MEIPSDIKCLQYLVDMGCKRRIIIHSCTVRAVADEIVSNLDGVNKQLIVAGALLHDIGRSVNNSIMHAYIGSNIIQQLGLPQEIIEIVRKHTGAGLDSQDLLEMGLPPGNYMPSTLEEKIVAHADNLVSDNKVVKHSYSVKKLESKGAFRGAKRIELLHNELSNIYGKDLDVI